MTLQEQAIEVVKSLPEDKLSELLHFAKILGVPSGQKIRKAGRLKGKIWVSDDFDEPMEEF